MGGSHLSVKAMHPAVKENREHQDHEHPTCHPNLITAI